MFQHHLELELVLNSYNKGHVFPIQFSWHEGLHDPKFGVEENLLTISLNP
jgi:hypothetical protein